MIQTLIPSPVKARAEARGFGYALTPRALLLLAEGCLLTGPGFFHPHWIWALVAWDALVVLLTVFDAALLPASSAITLVERFVSSAVLGETTEVEIEVTQESNQILQVKIADALHPALASMPLTGEVAHFLGMRCGSRCTAFRICAAILSWQGFSALSWGPEAGGALGFG